MMPPRVSLAADGLARRLLGARHLVSARVGAEGRRVREGCDARGGGVDRCEIGSARGVSGEVVRGSSRELQRLRGKLSSGLRRAACGEAHRGANAAARPLQADRRSGRDWGCGSAVAVADFSVVQRSRTRVNLLNKYTLTFFTPP